MLEPETQKRLDDQEKRIEAKLTNTKTKIFVVTLPNNLLVNYSAKAIQRFFTTVESARKVVVEELQRYSKLSSTFKEGKRKGYRVWEYSIDGLTVGNIVEKDLEN